MREPSRADWVVLDGYRFSAAYHKVVRHAGCKLMCVDDEGTCGLHGAELIPESECVRNAGNVRKQHSVAVPAGSPVCSSSQRVLSLAER